MRASLWLTAVLSLAPASALAHDEPAVVVEGARAIEGRLLAPCCWKQTLDVHESPLADQLRSEIRARLRRGEAGASIEADMVVRYGERVRAVPAGRDTRSTVPVFVGVAMLGSVVALAFAVRRWTRRHVDPAPPAPTPLASKNAYDARVDEELRLLDDA